MSIPHFHNLPAMLSVPLEIIWLPDNGVPKEHLSVSKSGVIERDLASGIRSLNVVRRMVAGGSESPRHRTLRHFCE
jgi:hypothetical protein